MSKYKKFNDSGEMIGLCESIYGNKNLESITDGEFLRNRAVIMKMNGFESLPEHLYHQNMEGVKNDFKNSITQT